MMNILYLYNNDTALPLAEWLVKQGESVELYSDRLTLSHITNREYDLIISYSYKYIIPCDIVEQYQQRMINMHISFLPWNRGENPNQWSFLEGTPQGVTIHFINEGLDKGDIIAQRLIVMDAGEETLFSSYNRLNQEIQRLFKEIYPYQPFWNEMRKRALGRGTYHSTADFRQYRALIDTWDMPVNDFINKAKALDQRK